MSRNNKIKYYKPTKEKTTKNKIMLIIGLIAIIISTTIIIKKIKTIRLKFQKLERIVLVKKL